MHRARLSILGPCKAAPAKPASFGQWPPRRCRLVSKVVERHPMIAMRAARESASLLLLSSQRR
jgi:hypothetical protein